MNGYVLAWMALSPISGPSIAAGILLGRKLQHQDSYRMGLEQGRMLAEYDQDVTGGQTATARLAQLRQQSSASTHDHDGPCSRERGCY